MSAAAKGGGTALWELTSMELDIDTNRCTLEIGLWKPYWVFVVPIWSDRYILVIPRDVAVK